MAIKKVSHETKKKIQSIETYNETKDRYFIDYDKVFSRNASMYFIIGEKSLGKTYGMVGYLYHHFMKTGRNFVYLRRRKPEWETTRTNIFKHYFSKEHINKEVMYKKNMLYIRDKMTKKEHEMSKDKQELWLQAHPWEFFGGTFPLESYGEVQGLAFEKVDTIFLDEFMIYNKQKRWIPDEPSALQNITQTVFRDNVEKFNCKTVCCSNAGTMTNPYFSAYDVQPKDFNYTNFVWRNKVLFINAPYSETDNKFLNGTKTKTYENFAIKNKFMDDSDLLILPREPKGSVPMYSIYVNDEKFITLYKSRTNYLFFGSIANTTVDGYAINRLVQSPKALYNKDIIRYLKKAMDNRLLFFSNAYIKNLFLEGLNSK